MRSESDTDDDLEVVLAQRRRKTQRAKRMFFVKLGGIVFCVVAIVGLLIFGASSIKERSGRARDVAKKHPPGQETAGDILLNLTAIRGRDGFQPQKRGETVAVAGEVLTIVEGESHIYETNGTAYEVVIPTVKVWLKDQTLVVCSFGQIRRSEFAAWAKRNPAGTAVTIKGTYHGHTLGDHFLRGCEFPP